MPQMMPMPWLFIYFLIIFVYLLSMSLMKKQVLLSKKKIVSNVTKKMMW